MKQIRTEREKQYLNLRKEQHLKFLKQQKEVFSDKYSLEEMQSAVNAFERYAEPDFAPDRRVIFKFNTDNFNGVRFFKDCPQDYWFIVAKNIY